ncbi:hypothetical protein CYY_001220 [Polysphondylium violaceum]|uniref:Uncharacterized protein n=1 Tax=Polysphondylium violaceum TaxID=133409 RepID=A0A8J4V842_9MYCE|nr:hypothetical protein CYY_001220 [Polysphondylium violaceum]
MSFIGIDLGSKNVRIAAKRNGKDVEIIQNQYDEKSILSCISFLEDRYLIGEKESLNYENTLFNFKRIMGLDYSQIPLELMDFWPFTVVNVNDKVNLQVKYDNETKTYSPEELFLMIILKIIETSENLLGHSIENASISIPCFFTHPKRKAILKACETAKLKVRLINEPVAAAMACSFGSGEKNVLVYDIGAYGANASIVTYQDLIYEVKASFGVYSGGEDFDNCLVGHFVQEFKIKYNKDISRDKKAMFRLKCACENAKITLSTSNEASISIEALFEGIDFSASITKAEFEECLIHLFSKVTDPIDQVLKDALMRKTSIDEIILIGGSSRIPKVQQVIQDFFAGKQLNNSLDPDCAVACGAAMYSFSYLSKECLEILLLDATLFSYGIETEGGMMEPIVNRNTTTPCKKHKTFLPIKEDQKSVLIKIYEGNRVLARDNILLGVFEFHLPIPKENIPQKIRVTFNFTKYTETIKVICRHKATGKEEIFNLTHDKVCSKEETIASQNQELSLRRKPLSLKKKK